MKQSNRRTNLPVDTVKLMYESGSTQTEVVHHINGIKTDNRPENLLVLGVNERHKLHNALNKSAIDEILLARIRRLEQELIAVTKKRIGE